MVPVQLSNTSRAGSMGSALQDASETGHGLELVSMLNELSVPGALGYVEVWCMFRVSARLDAYPGDSETSEPSTLSPKPRNSKPPKTH